MSLLQHATPLLWSEGYHVYLPVFPPSIRDSLMLLRSPPTVSLQNPPDQTTSTDERSLGVIA